MTSIDDALKNIDPDYRESSIEVIDENGENLRPYLRKALEEGKALKVSLSYIDTLYDLHGVAKPQNLENKFCNYIIEHKEKEPLDQFLNGVKYFNLSLLSQYYKNIKEED